MTGCKRCGARCHGRFCKSCARDEHRDEGVTGGESTDTSTNALIYECCDCGGQYQNEGPGQCPHCGYYGARYVDEPDTRPVMTDGGQTTEDYIDLGEKYDQRFDRPDYCRCDEQLIENAVCCACSQAGFGTPNPEAFAGGGD